MLLVGTFSTDSPSTRHNPNFTGIGVMHPLQGCLLPEAPAVEPDDQQDVATSGVTGATQNTAQTARFGCLMRNENG